MTENQRYGGKDYVEKESGVPCVILRVCAKPKNLISRYSENLTRVYIYTK